MTDEIRLYGMDGWESLYTDLESAVESHLADLYEPKIGDEFVFEEYDTCPVRSHMPSADHILEIIHEWTCDNGCVDEGFHEQMEKAVCDDEVRLKLDHVLDLIASKITYRMADKQLREIKVKITGVVAGMTGTVTWATVE
jgi:hypothetical protein